MDKFDEVLEDIRRVAEDKGYILNHEIDSLVSPEFSPEDIVQLYDRLSEEKIDFFDTPEKARLKIERRELSSSDHWEAPGYSFAVLRWPVD